MTDPDGMRARLAEAIAGDYELLHELGRRGMAAVYLALDRALDRRVATQVMAPHLVAVDGRAVRFLQEARLAAALSHPHIVPIHAVQRSGDLLFFVMRYVAGRSLDAVLAERGPLAVPMVRAILTQVGAALEAAHRKGVIHRDIKPASLLLDEHGDVLVADFGIARVAAQPGTTQVGQTVGTPEYMSSEQCAGSALTGAADQYSLGVVAYELLSGAPPFRGESLLQVVWKMMNDPPPLAVLRRDVPAAMSEAIARMMAREADERFASIAEAIAALPPLTLAPDDPVRSELVAYAKDNGGTPRPSSAQTRVVTPGSASRDGRVSAIGTGSATISAHAGDAMCSVAIVVTRAGLRAFALAPKPTTLEVADRLALAISSGESRAQLPHPRLADWSTSDPGVAHVDCCGTVTARAEGQVEITARAGGAAASVSFRVTRAMVTAVNVSGASQRGTVGGRLRFAAAPANTKGHPLVGMDVKWEVSDPAIAAISPEGELVALRSGQVLVSARVAGRVGTTRVTVQAPAFVG